MSEYSPFTREELKILHLRLKVIEAILDLELERLKWK